MNDGYYTPYDPYYCYPGTTVLINKLGIRDSESLLSKESTLVTIKIALMKEKRIRGSYDTNHLCSIHRELFSDIYEWAGEFRKVEMAVSIPFCRTEYIEPSLKQLFDELRKENYLRGINDQIMFAERLSYYLGELNVIHPFREGNGRTQRLFMEQLSYDAGWTVDLSTDRESMEKCSEMVFYGKYGPMAELILRTLKKRKNGLE